MIKFITEKSFYDNPDICKVSDLINVLTDIQNKYGNLLVQIQGCYGSQGGILEIGYEEDNINCDHNKYIYIFSDICSG